MKIPSNKFFAVYEFEGKTYHGECFDHRLNVESFQDRLMVTSDQSLFDYLTATIGKTKFFIGVEYDVLAAINARNREFLARYESPVRYEFKKGVTRFLDRDGILIVRSLNEKDNQLSRIFTEEEVERRLRLFLGYIRGDAHRCGAPCRSRGREGKPCAKLTYRERCYLHR